MFAKTLNMCIEKWKLASMDKYSARKKFIDSMGKQYPLSTLWEVNVVLIFHIYVDKAILYYFVFTKKPNMCIEK